MSPMSPRSPSPQSPAPRSASTPQHRPAHLLATALLAGSTTALAASPAAAATGTITRTRRQSVSTSPPPAPPAARPSSSDVQRDRRPAVDRRHRRNRPRPRQVPPDVTGNSTANGARLQLWDCAGSANEVDRHRRPRPRGPAVQQECADVTGNTSSGRHPVQIWTCTGAPTRSGPRPAAAAPRAAAPMAVAPYLYNGWGSGPPNPVTVIERHRRQVVHPRLRPQQRHLQPQWDGGRPLTGGVDQQTVNTVRANGGDVIPSFGGYSGNKLESSCSSASALAGAYQKVIDAYGLKAIDIDLEAGAYSNGTVQQRTVDALKTVKANNPGIKVYVTIGTGRSGPDTSLINRAANSGLTVDSWTIMPFDFGGAGQNYGDADDPGGRGLKERPRERVRLRRRPGVPGHGHLVHERDHRRQRRSVTTPTSRRSSAARSGTTSRA